MKQITLRTLIEMFQKFYKFVFDGKSNVWMAIFAGVLTVFNYYLWQVAERTLDSAMRTQRAFIFAEGVKQGGRRLQQDKNAVVEFVIRWNNTGTTPARGTLSKSNWQRFNSGLPKDFTFPDLSDTPSQKFPLGPQGWSQTFLNVGIDDIIAVYERRATIVFWGWFIYFDVFDGTPMRLTEFCHEIFQVESNMGNLTDPKANVHWTQRACLTHNCTDEDCPDYNNYVHKYGNRTPS